MATDLLTARLTSSEGQAAYTVSIFWGGITVGKQASTKLEMWFGLPLTYPPHTSHTPRAFAVALARE